MSAVRPAVARAAREVSSHPMVSAGVRLDSSKWRGEVRARVRMTASHAFFSGNNSFSSGNCPFARPSGCGK